MSSNNTNHSASNMNNYSNAAGDYSTGKQHEEQQFQKYQEQ